MNKAWSEKEYSEKIERFIDVFKGQIIEVKDEKEHNNMAEKLIGQIQGLEFRTIGDGELVKFKVSGTTVSTFQPDLVASLHDMKDGDTVEVEWKESEKPGKFGNKFKNLVSICLRGDESQIPPQSHQDAPKQTYSELTRKDVTISKLSLIRTAATLVAALVGHVESPGELDQILPGLSKQVIDLADSWEVWLNS